MAAPLKATFFALTPRSRFVLLPATLTTLAIICLIVALFAVINWNGFGLFGEMLRDPGAEPSDTQAMRIFSSMMLMLGSGFLLLFPLYIALAAFEAACLRWMIHGEAPGLFGLTLNADAWRVYGVYWCWLLTHMVIGFALSLLMMPVMFMTMGSIIMNPNADPADITRWQLSVQAPMTLAQYVIMIFIGIRLSPAAATSVARRQFSFFEAWTVTRERFWALFGSYLVLWLIFGAFYALSAALAFSPMIARVWPHVQAAYTDPSAALPMEALAAIFSPESLMWIGIGYALAIVVAFAYSVMSFGVNARAAMAAMEEGKIEAAPAS